MLSSALCYNFFNSSSSAIAIVASRNGTTYRRAWLNSIIYIQTSRESSSRASRTLVSVICERDQRNLYTVRSLPKRACRTRVTRRVTAFCALCFLPGERCTSRCLPSENIRPARRVCRALCETYKSKRVISQKGFVGKKLRDFHPDTRRWRVCGAER